MGHQQYVIPYDTDEQLQAILDVIKLHNQEPDGYTNEYIRFNAKAEYKRLEVGEELEGAFTVGLKPGKAYKDVHRGPCLSRALLVHHGGGRSCTFAFLDWHLTRALPDACFEGNHAVKAYGYESSMDKRFAKDSYEHIDGARIGVVPSAEYTDAMREANLACSWAVRPAKYTTRTMAINPVHTARLAERKKRSREERDVPIRTFSYETVTDGWVVEDKHFATREEAEAESVVVRDKLLASMKEQEEREKERRRTSFEANKGKVLDEAKPDRKCVYVFEKGHPYLSGTPKCFWDRTGDSPFCFECKRAMDALSAEDPETFQRRLEKRKAEEAECRAKRAEDNKQRFLEHRAEGKSLWRMEFGACRWFTDEGVTEARARGIKCEPGTVTYAEDGQEAGTPFKKASVAEVEAMLAAGKAIVLHGC